MADQPPQITQRGGRGGRGSRGGSRAVSNRNGSGSLATKSKIGPSRVLDADWAEDSFLKGNSFVVWVGGGQTAPRQYTFHRPIGETRLDGNSWVATPTEELRYLLERRNSEELSRWMRERSQAVRAVVLASKLGRELNTATPPQEVWTFDGAPSIKETIAAAMAAAKAAGKVESEWVNHTIPAVRASELQFKQALSKTTPAAQWEADHPRPTFETCGGPLGDRPQIAISYLSGYSISAAKDRVLGKLLSPDEPVEEEEDDAD